MGNFHERFDDHKEIDGPSNRSFGLTVGGILAAIGAVRFGFGHADWLTWVLVGLGAPLVVLALAAPALLTVPNRLWMKLGLLLFKIVNPVIMFLMYLICFVPVGIIMKVIRRDPLERKFDPEATTYWVEKKPAELENPMKHQF